MNLTNSIRHGLPVLGRPLAAILTRPARRGTPLALRVYANAVTIFVGPYSLTLYPGGRGIDRYEHHVRGDGDWFRHLSRNLPGGRYASAHLDRNPRWRRAFR